MNVRVSSIHQTKAAERDRLNIAHLLFLLFWVTKPFYLKASGSMQISDGIFVLSFFAWIIQNKWRVNIDKTDFYYIAFVGCIFLVNGFYLLIYGDKEFILNSVYYLYNLMIILVIRDFKDNKTFLKALILACCFNLLVQLIILLLDRGRFLADRFRYMGTFNDPNQFSFSMLSNFLLLYLLGSYFRDQESSSMKTILFGAFLIVFLFIFQSSSGGMLLGIISFSILMAVIFLFSENTPSLVAMRLFLILMIIAIVVFLIFFGGSGSATLQGQSVMITRLNDKLRDVQAEGIGALLDNRGIDKALTEYQYLFFGAGEGFYERFPDSPYEVHATFISILFCYGIIPFLIIVRWIWLNLKNTSKTLIPIYLALFIESFTLVHQRQPVFWMLILLGSLEFHNRDLRTYRIRLKL